MFPSFNAEVNDVRTKQFQLQSYCFINFNNTEAANFPMQAMLP